MAATMDEPIQFEGWEVFVLKNDLRKGKNKTFTRTIVELEMTYAEKEKLSDISSDDFPHTCRACLKRGELISILDSYVKQNDRKIQIGELLKDCVRIEVTERDGLPQNICIICLRKLMKIYNFCERCRLSEKTLKSARNTSQISEDDGQKSDSDFEKSYATIDDSSEEDDSSTELKKDLKLRRISNTARESTVGVNDTNKSSPTKSDKEIGPTKSKKEIKSEDEDSKPSTLNSSMKKSNEKPEKVDDRLKFIFKCKFCDVTCKTYAELQAHRREVRHSQRYQKCEVCDKMLPNRYIKEHMFTHAEEKPYKCVHCDRAFANNANYRRHLRLHTGDKRHMCEVCGKAFIQYANLQQHKNNHHKKELRFNASEDLYPPFQYFCEPCGRPFMNLTGFQHHNIKKHDPDYQVTPQGGKTYSCEKCGKSFKLKASLNNHRRVHSDETFPCVYCGKTFRSKLSLRVHVRRHTGERPYKCSICDKRFSQGAVLEIHMRLHTGCKPFSCDVCEKTFVQRHHVVYHMRTHTGEKPYVCDQCGKAFAHKANLTVHVRRHNNETPYSCRVCGKGFYDSSNRKKHEKIKHDVEIPYSQEVCDEKFITEHGTENVGNEYYKVPDMLFDSS